MVRSHDIRRNDLLERVLKVARLFQRRASLLRAFPPSRADSAEAVACRGCAPGFGKTGLLGGFSDTLLATRTFHVPHSAFRNLNRAWLALAVFLAGCVSPPAARYYTLDMRPSGTVKAPVNIEVDQLRESEAIGRKDILIKKSPTQIEYYARDQWAAALSEIVAQKLESEFGRAADNGKTIVITGTILDFEQVDTPDGAEAHVRLDLEFRRQDMSRYDPPLLKKIYQRILPADTRAPGEVVRALSRCLEKIAEEIASDAGALHASAARCPGRGTVLGEGFGHGPDRAAA